MRLKCKLPYFTPALSALIKPKSRELIHTQVVNPNWVWMRQSVKREACFSSLKSSLSVSAPLKMWITQCRRRRSSASTSSARLPFATVHAKHHMPFFFIALLCTLQAAKDILYWKGNHDSSPDRINLTAVQSLAVCHVTVPARLILIFLLYWWNSTINRVLVLFPLLGDYPNTPTPTSALLRPPQISLLSHLKAQKEKVKKT